MRIGQPATASRTTFCFWKTFIINRMKSRKRKPRPVVDTCPVDPSPLGLALSSSRTQSPPPLISFLSFPLSISVRHAQTPSHRCYSLQFTRRTTASTACCISATVAPSQHQKSPAASFIAAPRRSRPLAASDIAAACVRRCCSGPLAGGDAAMQRLRRGPELGAARKLDR